MNPWAIAIANVQTAAFVPAKDYTPIKDDGTGPRKWCKTCQCEHPLYVFRRYVAKDGRESYNPSCRAKYRSVRS